MREAAYITPSLDALRLGAGKQKGKDKALEGERLALGLTLAAVALLPLLVPSGPANLAPVDVLFVLAMAACLLWAGTSGHQWRFPYAVAMCFLLVGGAVGALAGPVPVSGITALLQDILLIAWCWTVVNLASSSGRLKVLLAGWVYSSIVWAVILFVGLATGSRSLTGHVETEGSRVALTLGDPNYAANYFFISIMLIWAMARPRRRGWRLSAYALLLAAMATTGSNSGILALIVGTAVATVVGFYARRGMLAAITALAFIVLGGFLVASNISLHGIQEKAHQSRYAFLRDGIGRGESTVALRDTLLHETIQLYETGGPLGEGPGSTKARLLADQAPLVKEAHDDSLAALTERGVLGFLGFLFLLGSLGFRSLLATRGHLAEGFAAVVPRSNALVGAVAGTMVAGTVYELLHVRHVWTLFAFVAALYVWGRK